MSLLTRLARRVTRRAPDFVIGGRDHPYLLRWFVIPRNRVFNIYLHEFRRSDDDRALHDHPWVNCSVLIDGTYTEHTIQAGGIHQRTHRKPGDVIFRMPGAAHRVEIIPGSICHTLFITGPRVREWGFHCPRGWVPWQRFVAIDDTGAVGAGCGED